MIHLVYFLVKQAQGYPAGLMGESKVTMCTQRCSLGDKVMGFGLDRAGPETALLPLTCVHLFRPLLLLSFSFLYSYTFPRMKQES